MTDTETTARKPRYALLGAALVVGIALAFGARTINPWIAGGLWLGVWVLIALVIRSLRWKQSLQLLVNVTIFGLSVMLWSYTAQQPQIRIDAAQLRHLPSSARSGLIELVARNTGVRPADIVVHSVAYVSPLVRNAFEMRAANIEAELDKRFERAKPTPATGTTRVDQGQTTVVTIEVPFSEQMWRLRPGDMTVIVAARIRYRDRLFTREKEFCQFANPQSGNWVSCPFLNN